MNTIVVPTDFSSAADNATAYAAQLSRQLQAPVLLLHVYQLPVPMTDYPVLMVTNEDLKKGADEGLHRALEAAQKQHPGIAFETESRLGDVATEIEEVCKEREAFALVVGAKDLSGFERFLFGDTTTSLLKNASFPVIAVPETTNGGVPTNIVLATDLQNLADVPAEKIAAITQKLGAALHVVHVDGGNDDTESPDLLMNRLQGIRASYHSVREDDVSEGLRHYVESNKIDLVVVVPHQHNLYERLFFKGHTQAILQALPVPVMSVK